MHEEPLLAEDACNTKQAHQGLEEVLASMVCPHVLS